VNCLERLDNIPRRFCSLSVGSPLWSLASYTDELPTWDNLVILEDILLFQLDCRSYQEDEDGIFRLFEDTDIS